MMTARLTSIGTRIDPGRRRDAAVVALLWAFAWLTPLQPLSGAAGLALLLVVPPVLLASRLPWPPRTGLPDRLLLGVGATLIGWMLLVLAVNTVLPFLGVDRPLSRTSLLTCSGAAVLALALWRRTGADARGAGGVAAAAAVAARPVAVRPLREWGQPDRILLGVGVLVVVGATAGAIRLNNGLGGTVATANLAVLLGLATLALCWRARMSSPALVGIVYLLSLALLLMTSLRGWNVTGHDIQREYNLFGLASGLERWDVGSPREAYNACLSTTLLPTLITKVTGVPGLYVFKVVFQALFALTSVVVYLISRRLAGPGVALTGVLFFVGFPTFFSDMPFMTRQEIAFLLLALFLYVSALPGWSARHRRVWLIGLGTGVVLAHYSTTYVLLATLVVGYLAWSGLAAVEGLIRLGRHRRVGSGSTGSVPPRTALLSLWVIIPLACVTVLWTGPITGTGQQVEHTSKAVLGALAGEEDGTRSSDTSYSLFKGAEETPEQRLDRYREHALDAARTQWPQSRYPLAVAASYDTPLAPTPPMPLTAAGSALATAGVDVPVLHGTVRKLAAALMQAFLVVGIAVLTWRRLRAVTTASAAPDDGGLLSGSRDVIALNIAYLALLASQVLLPALSVNYGILRAFQQALLLVSTTVVIGALAVLRVAGRRRAALLTGALAVGTVASLTGLLPQLTGGYPAQLHLNAAGQYYDSYYVHDQEVSGAYWLGNRIGDDQARRRPYGVSSDNYLMNFIESATGTRPNGELYPPLVRRDNYVFLGTSAVSQRRVGVFIDGDSIAYRYPVPFLSRVKNLVYDNGGTRVYR